MIITVVVIFTALVILFIFVFYCCEKIIPCGKTPVLFRQFSNSKNTSSVGSVILNQDDNNNNQEGPEREALLERKVSLNQESPSQNDDQILQLHSMPSQDKNVHWYVPQEAPLVLSTGASNSNIKQEENIRATPTSTKEYPYVAGYKQHENPPSYNEIENFPGVPNLPPMETISYNSGIADTNV